jgi:hypothetical protein
LRLLGTDVLVAIVISIGGLFLAPMKFFLDQSESLRNTYLNDVRKVQSIMKARRVVPKLIIFVKSVSGTEQSGSIEENLSQPRVMSEIESISKDIREMWKVADLYDVCVNSSMDCWKGFAVASGATFVTAILIWAGVTDTSAIAVWVTILVVVGLWGVILPLNKYNKSKRNLIRYVHDALLDRGG